jgi:hypothetical protein
MVIWSSLRLSLDRDPNGKPDQEVSVSQTQTLIHINARAPEVS